MAGFQPHRQSRTGLGRDFARALHRNFTLVFRDFGEETVTLGSHLEKLCLLRNGVGRDSISDFTTNLIKEFLATFSQEFAHQFLPQRLRKVVSIPRTRFNFQTMSWSPGRFEVPYIAGDYILLTPKAILTKDADWINRSELLDRFRDIADALPNAVLRAQVKEYLLRVLPQDPKAGREEFRAAIAQAVEKFPEILDYYIRDKEETGDKAVSLAQKRVRLVETLFVHHVREFVHNLLEPSGFYNISGRTYDEAKRRLQFLKDVIENKGGCRIFYIDGKPIEREADLHVLYRLTWYATASDLSHEVNDGRGPADFKVSRGAADKTLVEFKLANNKQLERNLANQSRVYEAASDVTHPSLKAILYFSATELERVQNILRRLNMENSPNIILLDARADNKPSGSKA